MPFKNFLPDEQRGIMGLFKHAHHASLDDGAALAPHEGNASSLLKRERRLFFKRWLRHPGQLGTLAPISLRLAQRAAMCIQNPDTLKIVEIGAGSGRLTRALLKHGVAPSCLKVVELDPELVSFTRQTLPHLDVIQGDARNLGALLPNDWIGNVDLVFSTIPFMCLEENTRDDIVNAALDVLHPTGSLLHLTYHPKSPLHYWSKEDLEQTKLLSLWANLPPAFVWRYTRKSDKTTVNLLKAS